MKNFKDNSPALINEFYTQGTRSREQDKRYFAARTEAKERFYDTYNVRGWRVAMEPWDISIRSLKLYEVNDKARTVNLSVLELPENVRKTVLALAFRGAVTSVKPDILEEILNNTDGDIIHSIRPVLKVTYHARGVSFVLWAEFVTTWGAVDSVEIYCMGNTLDKAKQRKIAEKYFPELAPYCPASKFREMYKAVDEFCHPRRKGTL